MSKTSLCKRYSRYTWSCSSPFLSNVCLQTFLYCLFTKLQLLLASSLQLPGPGWQTETLMQKKLTISKMSPYTPWCKTAVFQIVTAKDSDSIMKQGSMPLHLFIFGTGGCSFFFFFFFCFLFYTLCDLL